MTPPDADLKADQPSSDGNGSDDGAIDGVEEEPTPPMEPSTAAAIQSDLPPAAVAGATATISVADPNSPPWSITTKAIVASVIILLTGLIVWRFNFLIRPLVIAVILAYLLNPIIAWFERKLGLARGHAVLLVYGGLAGALIASGVLIGIVATDQILRLSRFLPNSLSELFAEIQIRVQALAAQQWTIGPYTLDFSVVDRLVDLTQIVDQSRAGLQAALTRGGSLLAGFATATVSTIGTSLVVLVVSIYIAIDTPKLGRTIGDLAQQPGYRADADRLVFQTLRIWNAYLRGQVVLAVAIFVIVSILLSLLQVSNAIALGVIAGFMEFLPVIGPVLSAVAAVLVAFFQSTTPFGLSPLYFALVVLAAMVVVQQIENALLVPSIVGDALDLHPIAVTVSVLMGTSLAGLLGAVLAAPVAASFKLYGAYVWRKMLDLPPFVEHDGEGTDVPHQRLGWSGQLQAWVRGISTTEKQPRR